VGFNLTPWILEDPVEADLPWLVIWELDIMIQLPVGTFLMYPSSLFIHFNIVPRGKNPLSFKTLFD